MKKVAISQSNYIPWKGYFDLINKVDEFILYDDAQFTRRDWRNRNKIKTLNGLQWLTIPVDVKGKYFQKIKETKISDKNWGMNHWQQIKQNYSKARHFKNYNSLRKPVTSNHGKLFQGPLRLKMIRVITCGFLIVREMEQNIVSVMLIVLMAKFGIGKKILVLM